MKSLSVYFIFLFLLNSTFCLAQENRLEADSVPSLSIEKRKHEYKVGAFKTLSVSILDVEYERRILNTYTSFGVNALLTGIDYPYRVALSPFYRIYFPETKEYGSKGLFVQTFLGYFYGKSMKVFNLDPIIKNIKLLRLVLE